MKNNTKSSLKISYFGKFLLFSVIFLVVFGALMVYSSSFYMAERNYGNKFFFLIKQVIGIVLGLVCMLFLSKVDYKSLSKFSIPLLVISFVLLLLVFVPFIGVENYGARRWIRLPFFTLQPSEIAKFSFVLFSATYLSRHSKDVKNFKALLPVLLIGISFCGLIILEPNMSITMCVAFIMIFMLFIGGMSFKHFVIFATLALIAVPVLILMEPYRLLRLLAFLDPWASPKGEGYQLIQSFFSVSNGGLLGVGLFNSRQKYLFLPFAESDFIFAVIAEEWGLIGSILVLLVYFMVVFSGIVIAKRAKDRFGCLLASGITSVIAIQTLLNLCVILGLIPPTGLPLPFISAGSTSLVVFLSAIGVLLNIDRQSQNTNRTFIFAQDDNININKRAVKLKDNKSRA